MALRDRYDNDILKTCTRIANSLERIERTLSNSDVKQMIFDDDGSELCPKCKCKLINYAGLK